MVGWMYIIIGQDVCFSTIVAYVWHKLVKAVWDVIVVSRLSFLAFFLS